MSVIADDIVIYASVNMPENDTDTSGGDINSGIRVVFEDIAATDQVEALSTSIFDSGDLTVVGRNAAGSIISGVMALSGTSVVTFNDTYERILKVLYNKLPSGTIQVRDQDTDTIIATLASGVTGIRRPFYDSAAEATGGSNKTLYEKVFVRNNNSTNALNGCQITEVASGLFAKVDFGLESGLNAVQSVTNRLTAPTGVTTYGNGPTSVPEGGALPPTEHQGMWLRLQLNAGDAAQNSFYQFQVTGTTT